MAVIARSTINRGGYVHEKPRSIQQGKVLAMTTRVLRTVWRDDDEKDQLQARLISKLDDESLERSALSAELEYVEELATERGNDVMARRLSSASEKLAVGQIELHAAQALLPGRTD
jgi:hypothetical protein